MTAAALQRQPVDVDGVSFDTVVLGDGPITVVFVNGMGTPLEEWALVAPMIAEHARVICYDRRQAPQRGRVPTYSAAASAADLHHLLHALAVTGPLVLVGHSWGGAVIRRYAFDHPDNVAGMVYVDASHESLKAMASPPPGTAALYTATTLVLRAGPIRRRLLRSLGFGHLPATALATVESLAWLADGRTGRAEMAGIAPSLRELSRLAPDLPDVPTQVLLAAGRPTFTTKLGARQLAKVRRAWEGAVAGRGDVTLQIVPDSGHYVPLDKPQAVIDAITTVVGQVVPRPTR